jgi:hypothetical protein
MENFNSVDLHVPPEGGGSDLLGRDEAGGVEFALVRLWNGEQRRGLHIKPGDVRFNGLLTRLGFQRFNPCRHLLTYEECYVAPVYASFDADAFQQLVTAYGRGEVDDIEQLLEENLRDE